MPKIQMLNVEQLKYSKAQYVDKVNTVLNYRMDVLTLGTFLSTILTVTTVWNTGETGDIYS